MQFIRAWWWLVAIGLAGCGNGRDIKDIRAEVKPRAVEDKGDNVTKLMPGPNAQQEVQTALIKAKPGETIEFSEGTFEFTMGLSLTVKDVTLRGKGMDKTFLSFKKQNAGKEGLLVQGTVDGFRMEDMTVEDT